MQIVREVAATNRIGLPQECHLAGLWTGGMDTGIVLITCIVRFAAVGAKDSGMPANRHPDAARHPSISRQ